MVMHWYVVHTYAGFENKAKAALEDGIRRSKLDARFGEVLVPTEKVVEVRDGQKKTTTRKVFPGYMFVQMVVDNETWHLVKEVPKVLGFIGGSSDRPAHRLKPDGSSQGFVQHFHPMAHGCGRAALQVLDATDVG